MTIGWFGKERVDYMTYDCKGIWRCYEIKTTKEDFHSEAKKTFLGHYNYYVMPQELYDQVKAEIPNYIGVYIGSWCKKRAKKRELGIEEKILKDSLIRSLSREVDKQIKSNSPLEIDKLNKLYNQMKKEKDNYYRMYWDLLREVQEKYGTKWNKN